MFKRTKPQISAVMSTIPSMTRRDAQNYDDADDADDDDNDDDALD